jgi:hypothetical protein
MLTTGDFSADYLTIKTEFIDQGWYVFFSGNDITPCLPIIRDAVQLFLRRDNTLGQMTASFREAYQGQLQSRINDEVLSRYDYDLESFKRDGLKQLGRDEFNKLCREIDGIYFDCEFLACGFDKDKKAHIFTVCNPGIIKDYSRPGFWAIGSGTNSALSTLFFHRYNQVTDMPLALYHVCEAKFMAESAMGVGLTTFAFVMRPSDTNINLVDHDLMKDIRRAWNEYGKARIPPDIESVIKAKFYAV